MGDLPKLNGREESLGASLGGHEDDTGPEEVGGVGAVQDSALELTKAEVDKNVGSEGKECVIEYNRIKNFVDVKKDPLFNSALEEWTRELKEARNNLVDKGKEKADLTTQVYNIVGFFSVFQGVVLTAVSQLASGSLPKCQKTWFPILLSVVATLVAVVALLFKFRDLEKLEKSITEYAGKKLVLSKRVDKLLKFGPKVFDWYEDVGEAQTPESSFWVLKICTLVTHLVFTGIFVFSYLVILCDKFLM